ncbi:CHAP domain-containing protein [Staphylococcus haemolyticus]|jgi:surface antigen|uniref:N-acetylmuramoyl-L-alanine amidase n=2 Tax=Staphylococcus TaxID=1279 RepID=A0A2A1KAQ4_STAHA|nr:CHAP domain-containing protein [Staphylococcus haemolyticus]KDP47391.1 secretory antigen SsaA family protein [Staphylococcus aureus subsp. aureus CO-98]OFM09438.1 N-acetylmuramoyl-L-alanine amidase [Staphylococcus sp. HMSC069D07]OFM10658.1 N-acetylmuramoyl-L-alanine amidase [Staphylococcus sp. HMSC074C02]OFM37338.1 N-acetylmuramoyl-L-alanine amidase [Staphylococcus sp. HMSC076E07]OFM39617.1 N-acetylmuramoyl-L-alanine amidase [Staphylococcus sp. HMSC076B11]OFO71800.1 N-acetylmuramoyl-L-alan
MINKTLTVTLTSIAALAGLSGLANAQEHTNSTPSTSQQSNNNNSQVEQETNLGLTNKDIVKVKAGDTLYQIALSHHLSLEQLYNFNPGVTALIHPGDLIAVSEKGAAKLENKEINYAQTYAETIAFNQSDVVAQSVSASTTNVTGYNIVPTSAPTTTTHDSYHSPVNTPVSYQHVTTANQGNRYSFGNCTYYAFDRRQQLGRSIGSYWGNANNWAYSAKNAGLTVDNRPEVGAIFQTTAGYYGHVGVVEHVNQDGSVYVSEMNWNGHYNHVTNRTITNTSSYNFIH